MRRCCYKRHQLVYFAERYVCNTVISHSPIVAAFSCPSSLLSFLATLTRRIFPLLLCGGGKRSPSSQGGEYMLVDDASGDGTVTALHAFRQQHPERVRVVALASNVGPYNAIVAGIAHATGDCNVVITADM
nr:glycosyltransferase [Hymenobacter sediminis]